MYYKNKMMQFFDSLWRSCEITCPSTSRTWQTGRHFMLIKTHETL